MQEQKVYFTWQCGLLRQNRKIPIISGLSSVCGMLFRGNHLSVLLLHFSQLVIVERKSVPPSLVSALTHSYEYMDTFIIVIFLLVSHSAFSCWQYWMMIFRASAHFLCIFLAKKDTHIQMGAHGGIGGISLSLSFSPPRFRQPRDFSTDAALTLWQIDAARCLKGNFGLIRVNSLSFAPPTFFALARIFSLITLFFPTLTLLLKKLRSGLGACCTHCFRNFLTQLYRTIGRVVV